MILVLLRNRFQNAALVASTIAALVLLRTSRIRILKQHPTLYGGGIATMTTVGYGDKYPVTDEGRIVASILMISGVGLFGTFTGLVSAFLVSPKRKEHEASLEDVLAEVKALRAALENR
jgi:voltage-gated potassium channel